MARTPAGDLLTSTYRGQLLRLRAQSLRDYLTLWPLLSFDNLQSSYDPWRTAVEALIERDRKKVTDATFAYLTGMKSVEVGGRADLLDPDDLAPELLATSLRVTSIVTYNRALGQIADAARASKIAFVTSSGASTRLILNAGRSATTKSVQADRRGFGWARVTSSHPCEFCAGLVDKLGRVESSVDFPAHDHCLCSAEPVYR